MKIELYTKKRSFYTAHDFVYRGDLDSFDFVQQLNKRKLNNDNGVA